IFVIKLILILEVIEICVHVIFFSMNTGVGLAQQPHTSLIVNKIIIIFHID
ncbi:hypothetical protein ACJX0J_008621, partial [Zea mays]